MAFDLYKYQADYAKKNLKRFEFKLQKERDKAMIDWLISKGNFNAYIRGLVQKDMDEHPIPDEEAPEQED